MTKYVLLCAVMVGAALAGYPAGEFLVDTVPRYSAAAAYYPTVGANGSEFLIAWGGMFRTTARLVRVTTGGALLDTGGVSLGDVRTAPMAFDGTRFLVVWHSGSSGSRDVYAARLAADGTVLDPAGFLVSGATGNQQKPAVTFDGTQFVVVWQDARNGGEDIYAARVSGAGAVLDPDGIPVCTDTADQGDPRIAGSGAGALAVWHDARRSDSLDIFAARISPAGTVLDPHGIAVCAGSMYQGYPSVGFGGGQWLVAWEDDRDGDWYFDVWAARVSSAGVVLDPGGFAVSDTIRDQDEVGVVHNGTDFLVYWADYRRRGDSSDIYCSRVAASGTVLDPTGIAVSAAGRDQYTLSAAVLDGTTFLAWEDFRLGGNTPTVYGARVSAAGTVLDPAGIPLAHSAATQSGPVAAGNGTDWLAVWSETRGAAADVYGQRLGPTGVRLDAEPFLISGAANDQANPAVGFDGANWLVVWEDERWGNIDLYAARVSPAGLVLDSAGISVYRGSYAQVNPALAFDGTNYLVAWDNWVTNTHDILGRFVSPAGVVDTHAVRISTATGDQYQPALAFDGTNYLAAWTDGRSSFSSVRCARIAPGGTVLDTAGILVRDSAGNPAVAAGGGQYLLAWADYRRNPYVADAAAGRVSSAGTVLDPGGIMLSTADGNQGRPTAGFDGADYVVVWQDERSDPQGYTNADLYGASVTTGGARRDSFAVCRDPQRQWYPRLCDDNTGALLLVYQGWADYFGGRSYNAFRAWAKLSPLPGVEERRTAARSTSCPSIVHGVLSLPKCTSPSRLLNISGRSVLDLHPGPNDISRLAPGVYFVRQASGVARVVLTK